MASSNIQFIEKDTFDHMLKLESLLLTGNTIRTLSTQNFLSNVPSLKQASLNFNTIVNIKSGALDFLRPTLNFEMNMFIVLADNLTNIDFCYLKTKLSYFVRRRIVNTDYYYSIMATAMSTVFSDQYEQADDCNLVIFMLREFVNIRLNLNNEMDFSWLMERCSNLALNLTSFISCPNN